MGRNTVNEIRDWPVVLCKGFIRGHGGGPTLRRFQRDDDKLGAHWDELARPCGSRKHSCLLHAGLVTRLHGLYMGCALWWSKSLDTSFPSPTSNPDEGLESWGRIGRVWAPMSGMLLVYALYWFFALLHGWAMISCSDCLLGSPRIRVEN